MIVSSTWKENIVDIKLVLQALNDNGLTVKEFMFGGIENWLLKFHCKKTVTLAYQLLK